MKIIDINRNTLYNLYEQFPQNLSNISLEGNNLIYQGEAVNISKFNINNLLNEKTSFAGAINILTTEDIFRIIELHAVFLTKVGLPIIISDNQDKENNDNGQKLLSQDEFFSQLNSSDELTDTQRKNIDIYYVYLERLVLYEEFLLPELQHILSEFRNYLFELEYVYGVKNKFNSKQEEVLRKSKEFEYKKAQRQGLVDEGKKQNNSKRLELKKENNTLDEAGVGSALLVIIFIVIIAVILTIITFKVVG